MKNISFDFNNMMADNVGPKDGVTAAELNAVSADAEKAFCHIQKILSNEHDRINIGLEWARLPFQDKSYIRSIQKMGDKIASSYENVISLGIGGSYLGLKAAQDALCPPYYNEFRSVRGKRPKIYFDGNNLDPDTLAILLKNLNPKKTFVIVISKSGETTETKAAFIIIEEWLKKRMGKKYGRQIFAITDPKKGSLRKKADIEQSKDPASFKNLAVAKGVGGRFSELNIGLLHLAISGIKIQEVLDGAAAMAKRCGSRDIFENPALMYAALNTILYRKKGKSIAVMMPFSEGLKSTADWYVQLLAESLGKKYARTITASKDGVERWAADKNRIVNAGRTPVSSRGTNDLHSIQQNNIEGENNKTATFIKIDKFRNEVELPRTGDLLSGKLYSKLLSLAEEATEWAMTREGRPNCTITMPRLTPFNWGELIFFFEMATAFEGEFLDINAFDQPGVEGYKNYMYYKLNKPGMPEDVTREIKDNPLRKKEKFIL